MKRCMGRKKTAVLMVICAMAIMLSASPVLAKRGDEKYLKKAQEIAEENGTEAVKTICWKARTSNGIKAPSEETGEEVTVQAGSFVKVIQRDYHEIKGISLCEVKKGVHCYIANKYLRFVEPLATGAKGDYSREAKLAYINGQTIKSNTDTLIWVSLDKQRVNIFRGKNRHWELIRTCKASTGKVDAPTLDQTFKKKYVVQKKIRNVNDLWFYTFFFGSGIHKWPGEGMKYSLGKTPESHSCVRLNGKNAKWVFENDNVPLKSRVWIW